MRTHARRRLVARHARAYGAAEPLQIVEVGGGNGTAALGILDYLRREAPDAFATCRYLSLEVSPLLAEVQRQRLADAGVGSDTFTVVHAPFDEWRGRLTDGVVDLGGPWHAVALEVLDNLPHDKIRLIRRHAPRDADADADGYATDLYEARVTPPPPSAPPTSRRGHESWEPLADELLTRVVSIIGLDTHAGVDSLEEDMLNPPGSGIAGEMAPGLLASSVATLGLVASYASRLSEKQTGDEGDDPPKEVIGLFAVLAFFGFATATQSLFAAGILGVPQLPDFFGSGDLPDDLGL